MSFFRYPGGKAKLRAQIVQSLIEESRDNTVEYREPFFGGGSIGIDFLSNVNNISGFWINDKDPGIASLWYSVINYHEELKKMVRAFVPSIDEFYIIKQQLLLLQDMPERPELIVLFGFKKLAIHQISYSGLGTKSGGPLGGASQESQYKIDCRWSAEYICRKIDRLHSLFYRFNNCLCTADDFESIIADETKEAIIYLDPPYYIKGNDLYQCGFTQDDHERLARVLSNTSHRWVLSYDDCPEIQELYSWARIKTISVNYTITTSRTKSELLICNT